MKKNCEDTPSARLYNRTLIVKTRLRNKTEITDRKRSLKINDLFIFFNVTKNLTSRLLSV